MKYLIENIDESRVVEAFDGAGGGRPDALAECAFGPVLLHLGDIHCENGHMADAAPFFVQEAADRFRAKGADQTRFFPKV